MDVSDSQPLPDLFRRRKTPRPLWLRFLCLVGAAIFIVLGIVFWLLPVVSGIPFYIVALVCLGVASDRVGERINALERKLSLRSRLKLREWLRKAPIRKVREMGRLQEDEHHALSPEVAGSARGS